MPKQETSPTPDGDPNQTEGLSLAQNLELLKRLSLPATESEALRIGNALVVSFAAAAKAGLNTPLDPCRIYFDKDGSLQILPSSPNSVSAASRPPSPRDIANLIVQLLCPASDLLARPVSSLDRISNLSLRSALAQALDEQVSTLEEFAILLDGASVSPIAKSRGRMDLILAGALAAVLVVGFFSSANRSASDKDDQRQLAAEIRKTAAASAAQWRAFALDYTDALPPQTAEAEQLFAEADKLWASGDFEKAKPLYARANLLYDAGMAVAKEFFGNRNLAQAARLQALTVGADWLRLAVSPYVELPEAAKQGQEALSMGDFRLLDHKYQEAQMAYDLAVGRFQSVPAAQLKALTLKHEARANSDRAEYAEKAWKQIAPGAGELPEAATQAIARMAEGRVYLAAGNDAQAATAFREAHDLYASAQAAFIKAMIARQEIADAQDRALDAAQRWRSLSTLWNEPDSPEIAQADSLAERASQSTKAGKQDDAKKQFASAMGIYEHAIAGLQERAATQCETDMEKAKQCFDQLQTERATIETNLMQKRNDIASINLRLVSEKTAAEHESLLKDLESAHSAYAIASRLSSLCDAVVFAGPKYDHAKSSLEQARDFVLQGNKVAAVALSGPALADLQALTRLPSEIEGYLTERVNVAASAESTRRLLGPIAREQPQTQKNLAQADQLLGQAEEQIKLGNAEKARRMLTDARLYFETLPTQAVADLQAYAVRADSEFRTDSAIAALNELLALAPANSEAKRLRTQFESKDRPHDRLAILDGSWRLNGQPMPKFPTKDDLERVLGPSRALAGEMSFAFDNCGIMAILDPEKKKVAHLTAYYGPPQLENEPHKAYPGIVEVEGVSIKHDDSMSVLASSVQHWNPQIIPANRIVEFKVNNFRVHVLYRQANDEIYTVSVGFGE